jgi:hypothetical protein
MEHAICAQCAEDAHLKKLIEQHGEVLECSECEGSDSPAISVTKLGRLIEPIMRKHFQLGKQVRIFEEDDRDWWDQEGETLSSVVQEILGQSFNVEDEIVSAVIDAEDCWPPDGDEPFWAETSCYVQTRIEIGHYYEEWRNTLYELKYGRRFFSPAAQKLFSKLFTDVEQKKVLIDGKYEPVIFMLPQETTLYRARVCKTKSLLQEIMANPFRHVGPPPQEIARAGRMNADGVSVFYCALDMDTCLAEMRPALGNELAVIAVKTTKPLRVLDLSRLDVSRGAEALSYLQPDFTQQVEKNAFLRRLQSLVSQPIVPGHESDYLITQTMAEYLAHVHNEPFNGILFSSAQRAGGRNVVLFSDLEPLAHSQTFGIEYVEGSVEIQVTTGIEYAHQKRRIVIDENDEVYVHKNFDDDEDFDD